MSIAANKKDELRYGMPHLMYGSELGPKLVQKYLKTPMNIIPVFWGKVKIEMIDGEIESLSLYLTPFGILSERACL